MLWSLCYKHSCRRKASTIWALILLLFFKLPLSPTLAMALVLDNTGTEAAVVVAFADRKADIVASDVAALCIL